MASTLRGLSEVVKEFNTVVFSLLNRIERKARTDLEAGNLDRLRKRISLLKSTMGDNALIDSAAPFFLEYKDPIMYRDESFFTNLDARNECIRRKGAIEKSDEFIFSLVDSTKVMYNSSSVAEKDTIYAEIKRLFTCSVEFELAKL